MTKAQIIQERTNELGLLLCTYSPGDGYTRYRFFRKSEVPAATQTYFGPANGLYTALGYKEAMAWLAGYSA